MKYWVLAAFLILAKTTAEAACLPGTYDAKRGIQNGDCYTAPEANIAMKEFGQRTVITGQRYTYTGRKFTVAQREYSDRQVIDMYMYLSNEDNYSASITDMMKREGISRDAATKRALNTVELASLQYRDAITSNLHHIRFTMSSDGARGFCMEGNGATNQESSEFTVVCGYRNVALYNTNQSESLDYSRVGHMHANLLNKSKERLMLSGISRSNVVYIVTQNKWSSNSGSLLAASETEGEDMGHIRNIEYTPVALQIFESRKK